MISLNKISKYPSTAWYVEHTSARPFMLSGIIRGFTSGLKLKEYDFLFYYCKKGEIDWITLIENQNEIGELIFKEHKKDKNFWKKEFKKWLEIRKKIEDNLNQVRKKDLSKISERELLSGIKRYVELQWEERKVSSLMDPFIFYSERKLPEFLNEFAKKNPFKIDIRKAGEVLTKPEDPSFFSEAEFELIKIAEKIAKNSELKEKFVSDTIKEEDIKGTEIYKIINKHLNRYVWIKVESFFGAKDYTFKDVIEHLKELLKSDLREKLKKNQSWIGNKKIRQDYISKYKFNEQILAISELSPLFAKWQDLRKESTLTATYLASKYLKEISQRTGIDEDDLAYLDYSEIENFIKKDIDVSLLKKRKEGCLFLFVKDKFEVFYEDEIKEIINKIINPDYKEVNEFPGMIASSGRAKGAVKIVIKLQDISKVEKGDILVSTMTRPEHMAAMKKASAIITNEGGITCHAAIVSRELGIPCIIGTKIATKVLKDGDLVEVDAEKGIVRILG